ncbi:MAG: hypothetical protein ABIN94_00815 [Ferruginibacter sp.]
MINQLLPQRVAISGALLVFPFLWQWMDPAFEESFSRYHKPHHQPGDLIQPVAGIKLGLFLRYANEME